MLVCFLGAALAQQAEVALSAGMVITSSVKIKKDVYRLVPVHPDSALITIVGDTVTVDFNGAEIVGSTGKTQPDEYWGTCIKVVGSKGVVLKNAVIRHFRVGVYGFDARKLQVVGCDISYGYRPKLLSSAAALDGADKLSYSDNSRDEWMKMGAAVFVKSSNNVEILNSTLNNNVNGVVVSMSSNQQFMNNTICYNSGVGIGLFRVSNSWFTHNRLDYNSRGVYGSVSYNLDAAGFLVHDQCSQLTIAFNSMTHCGNGLLMSTVGQRMFGGTASNSSTIYGNDFSFAANIGLKAQGNSRVINNTFEGSQIGITGVNLDETTFVGNKIKDCRQAIYLINGQTISLYFNKMEQCGAGFMTAYDDGLAQSVYAKPVNGTTSRGYTVIQNFFKDIAKPLIISNSRSLKIDGNQFVSFDTLLTIVAGSDSVNFINNLVYDGKSLADADSLMKVNERIAGIGFKPPYAGSAITGYAPKVQREAVEPVWFAGRPRGRTYMTTGNFGPYDFGTPMAILRSETDEYATIELVGPEGSWRLLTEVGKKVNEGEKAGKIPATVTLPKLKGNESAAFEFEFTGATSNAATGEVTVAGKAIKFGCKK